jgi:hypothetical protein
VLEFLVKEMKQEKIYIKGKQIAKKKLRLSLFADDMILYLEDPVQKKTKQN